MDNTKLIKLLKSLSVEEFKRLHKVVQSPLLTTNHNVEKLYLALRPFYPVFEGEKFNNIYLYHKVFPKQAYRDGKFRKLRTEMSRVVEDYLIYLELEEQKFQRQQYLTKIYGKRNLYDCFEKNTFRLVEQLDQFPYRDMDYHWNKMDLEQQYFAHPFTYKMGKKSRTEIPTNNMNALDDYYMMAKLRMACDLRSRSIHLKEEHTIQFLDEIREVLAQKTDLSPVYVAYLGLIDLLEKQEIPKYWDVRNVFLDHICQFSRVDQKTILHYLFNFAIGQVNQGITNFRIENFELYKFGLKQGLLIENKVMSDIAFTNIASYGASFCQFDWTLDFINQYQAFLSPLLRKEAIQLSLGFVAFFQKDYSKTIDLLQHVIFHKTSHRRRSKGLLLRSYFEMSLINQTYLDLFFSFMDSFQKSLYRNSLDSDRKVSAYLNLIKYLKKVALFINAHQWTIENKQQILEAIQVENMALKSWFETRLSEL